MCVKTAINVHRAINAIKEINQLAALVYIQYSKVQQ